jgi:DNA-3-methyladenine glycosylase II
MMNDHCLSERNIEEALSHLANSDPVMAKLVANYAKCQLTSNDFPPFHTLTVSIVSQQLSAKAADTILIRMSKITGSPFCPANFLAASVADLRAAGVSSRKINFIRAISEGVISNRLSFEELLGMSDEEVIESLTKFSGIGRWTAEMFLIFGLKRPDVLALGDAGLQRAAKLLYGKPDELNVLARVSSVWRPYRSVASWYLWKYLDVAVRNDKHPDSR